MLAHRPKYKHRKRPEKKGEANKKWPFLGFPLIRPEILLRDSGGLDIKWDENKSLFSFSKALLLFFFFWPGVALIGLQSSSSSVGLSRAPPITKRGLSWGLETDGRECDGPGTRFRSEGFTNSTLTPIKTILQHFKGFRIPSLSTENVPMLVKIKSCKGSGKDPFPPPFTHMQQ